MTSRPREAKKFNPERVRASKMLSIHGKEKLRFRGYAFNKNTSSKHSGAVYWRCCGWGKFLCAASLKSSIFYNDEDSVPVESLTSFHNHEPDFPDDVTQSQHEISDVAFHESGLPELQNYVTTTTKCQKQPSKPQHVIKRRACRVCLEPETKPLDYIPIFAEGSNVALRIFLISGVQVSFLSPPFSVISLSDCRLLKTASKTTL